MKLKWRQPSFWRSRYELCFQDGVIGTYRSLGLTGKRGEFESGTRKWIVGRSGAFRTRIEVLEESGGEPVAAYQQEAITRQRGRVIFNGGEEFAVRSKGMMEMKFEVVDENDHPVFEWKTTWGFGRDRVLIDSIDPRLGDDHVAALALIALRIKIEQSQNAAAAGG